MSRSEQTQEQHPTPATYIKVGIMLTIITALEIWVVYIKALADIVVPILVILSFIKFVLVVMFYMHLKFDSKVFSGFFAIGFVMAVGLALAVVVISLSHGAETATLLVGAA